MLAESDFAFNRRSCQKPTHPPTPTPSTSKRKGLQRPSTPVRQPTFLETGERTALGTRSKTSASGSLPKMGGLLQYSIQVGVTNTSLRPPPSSLSLPEAQTYRWGSEGSGLFRGLRASRRLQLLRIKQTNKKNRELKVDTPEALTFLPTRKRKTAAWLDSKHRLASTFFSRSAVLHQTPSIQSVRVSDLNQRPRRSAQSLSSRSKKTPGFDC